MHLTVFWLSKIFSPHTRQSVPLLSNCQLLGLEGWLQPWLVSLEAVLRFNTGIVTRRYQRILTKWTTFYISRIKYKKAAMGRGFHQIAVAESNKSNTRLYIIDKLLRSRYNIQENYGDSNWRS